MTELSFSGKYVSATLVRDAKDFPVHGRAIVVNLDTHPAYVGESPRKGIPAFSSTILVDSRIARAAAVLLLRYEDEGEEIGGIVDEPGWRLFADILPSFPRDTPLWRSTVDTAGPLWFDPVAVLDAGPTGGPERPFRVSLNLWFAPAGTDCRIHNRHDFIEVHTQVFGLGRMQKFRTEDPDTLYEEQLMSPGYTTPTPFCELGTDPAFVYPWHQYRADTDCVWLAVEYHLADQEA